MYAIAKIDGFWYGFTYNPDTHIVRSLFGGETWFAQGFTDGAIKYVSSPVKKKETAIQQCIRSYAEKMRGFTNDVLTKEDIEVFE